jgi:hypothetical protein
MSIFLLHVFQLSGVFQWRHTTGISWYLWRVCGMSPVSQILVACPRHATGQLSMLPCWWHSETTPPTAYFLLVHMDGLRNWRILDQVAYVHSPEHFACSSLPIARVVLFVPICYPVPSILFFSKPSMDGPRLFSQTYPSRGSSMVSITWPNDGLPCGSIRCPC